MGKAFIIAETTLDMQGLSGMLDHLGAGDWLSNYGEEVADAEMLTEVAGRLCYKSFNTELNPNITRIREGNELYLSNVMKQKHGSVFEHASVSVAFLDVSRILTHELVRHRPAVGYSQESQRFVRLDQFDVYIPDLTDPLTEISEWVLADATDRERSDWVDNARDEFFAIVEEVKSDVQGKLVGLVEKWGMDIEGVPFHVKKQLTSALRRFVPGGVNTHIIASTNHRMWRHMIESRTSPGAEIEIIEAFGQVAEMFKVRYPHIYQDMITYTSDHDSMLHYRFENQKI